MNQINSVIFEGTIVGVDGPLLDQIEPIMALLVESHSAHGTATAQVNVPDRVYNLSLQVGQTIRVVGHLIDVPPNYNAIMAEHVQVIA